MCIRGVKRGAGSVSLDGYDAQFIGTGGCFSTVVDVEFVVDVDDVAFGGAGGDHQFVSNLLVG